MIKAQPGHDASAIRELQVRSKIASIILSVWPGVLAGAQPNDKVGPSPPTPQATAADSAVPREGLWPSSKLLGSLLARVADQVAHRYELDEDQRKRARDLITSRWKTFLDDNRNELQPLLNEFIEMRMDLEPPDKDRVEQWAKRAGPAFELFREQIETGASEFREVLTPRQRTQFEVERLQLGFGLTVAEQKLRLWQQGQFEEREFWQPPPAERRRRREQGGSAKEQDQKPTATEDAKTETDPILQELAAWDRYVEQLILLYKFDDAQRTTALSVLTELKGRALDHRQRRKEDIASLENRIGTFSGSDDELDELQKRLTELYGPVDDMFEELKRRLDSILSPAQHEAAGKR